MSADPLTRMQGIDKAFPGVQALKDAQFELLPREVHALVGENGAGKSTLMKVLTGITSRTLARSKSMVCRSRCPTRGQGATWASA